MTDLEHLERCASIYRLLVPRVSRGSRVGGIAGTRAGGSLELQDFREYQPGDDLRQLDWNAVARTEQLIVRVRREEVSPRVELVVDTSRSMAVDDVKATRTRTLARLLFRLAKQEGLSPALVLAGENAVRRVDVEEAGLERVPFEGRSVLGGPRAGAGALRPCGVRIVLSDFLFETSFDALAARCAEGASLLAFVQVLADADLDPEAGGTTALEDSESGDRLERELTPQVVAAYKRRLAAHKEALESAARRVRGSVCLVRASQPLEEACRTSLLGHVLEVQA